MKLFQNFDLNKKTNIFKHVQYIKFVLSINEFPIQAHQNEKTKKKHKHNNDIVTTPL